MAWMLEGAPGGRAWTLPALPLTLLALGQAGYCLREQGEPWWLLVDDLTAAAMLGSAMTAMLMGHSSVAMVAAVSPVIEAYSPTGIRCCKRPST